MLTEVMLRRGFYDKDNILLRQNLLIGLPPRRRKKLIAIFGAFKWLFSALEQQTILTTNSTVVFIFYK